MTKARKIANLVETDGDIKSEALENVPPSDWNTLLNKPSVALTNGSNASGTWPVSVTGNAGSASSVAWANVSGKPTIYGNCSNCAGDLNAVSFTRLGNLNGTVNNAYKSGTTVVVTANCNCDCNG